MHSSVCDLGSISSTCLRKAFTPAVPESTESCLGWLSFIRFCDLRTYKLQVKCWWNRPLTIPKSFFLQRSLSLKKKYVQVFVLLRLPHGFSNPRLIIERTIIERIIVDVFIIKTTFYRMVKLSMALKNVTIIDLLKKVLIQYSRCRGWQTPKFKLHWEPGRSKFNYLIWLGLFYIY